MGLIFDFDICALLSSRSCSILPLLGMTLIYGSFKASFCCRRNVLFFLRIIHHLQFSSKFQNKIDLRLNLLLNLPVVENYHTHIFMYGLTVKICPRPFLHIQLFLLSNASNVSRFHPHLCQIVLLYFTVTERPVLPSLFTFCPHSEKKIVKFKIPSSTIASSKQPTEVITRNYVNVTKSGSARGLRGFYQ